MNDDHPTRETLVKELPPSFMNEPPKWNLWAIWLDGLLGGIMGAVVGGVAAVFIPVFLLGVVYPMFVKVDWDRCPGLGVLLIFPAALGIIIGAVVGAKLAMRRLKSANLEQAHNAAELLDLEERLKALEP